MTVPLKTGQNITLLKTNIDSGHGGVAGCYDYLKDEAFKQTFILSR
jgi:oligopeptidase B